MRKYLRLILFIIGLLITKAGYSHGSYKLMNNRAWNATWITVPGISGEEYGVYYFRKSFNITTKPHRFIVKVSADNRYKLYVNSVLVSVGPARSDGYYWNYETIDLSPYLSSGKNVISAVVWNEAEFRPEAQTSLRTGFILQGDTSEEEIVNTNYSWKCIKDSGYTALTGIGYPAYYIAGASELLDMNKSIQGWQQVDFYDNTWANAIILDRGNPKGVSEASGWMLVPSPLPQMERTVQRISVLRKAEGVTPPPSFPLTKTAFTVPANSVVTLLLDQTYLTNAYLTLNFSKGKGARLSVSYAEALFKSISGYSAVKGNRNDVNGMIFVGRKDSLISNGNPKQSFTTLYWRTFRYIKLRIETKDDPLVIDDIYGTFTGYPFQLNAKLKAVNPEMQQMLDIGWRTARLDALETYMDCPYFEQLQYVGDTRIQAVISYFNSGDDRLAKNAINLIDRSRLAEGITLSRYPSRNPQLISTFSLGYIGMLHDFWMYRADKAFIKSKLAGERSVLEFFAKYQQSDGSIKDLPYWCFVDWAENKRWIRGVPPKGIAGESAVLDLQLLIAYQQAAEMESQIGLSDYAKIYNAKADQLKQTIQKNYWDSSKKLYADNKDKDTYSQHANSLAILSGIVNPLIIKPLAQKLLADTSLTQCTIYFKYYLNQALVKGGLGNNYLNWLDIWRKSIAAGMTTWGETSDLATTRSDCHAWAASPNIEFFRTVLGIDTYAPGFTKIIVEPHLGDLKKIEGEIPHPNGIVSAKYVQHDKSWSIKISLPKGTTGLLVWKTKKYLLKAGENVYEI